MKIEFKIGDIVTNNVPLKNDHKLNAKIVEIT
jgi:hypothetical protein